MINVALNVATTIITAWLLWDVWLMVHMRELRRWRHIDYLRREYGWCEVSAETRNGITVNVGEGIHRQTFHGVTIDAALAIALYNAKPRRAAGARS